LYSDYYDQLPYPKGYIVPKFSKFSGEDGKIIIEHVGQFILQYCEISANNALKLRMFYLSLSGTAFTWFTSLATNSIFTWAQLEHKFHEYFYSGVMELRLSHLTVIKQKHNEHVIDYIKRFRYNRNRCFNLNISDEDLVDLAYSRLSLHLKEKLESHTFFFMLAKSCKMLWIMKAESKSLEALLGVVISLGMSVMLIWLSIVASRQMMRKPTCV
jgi:hypothetical protein